MKKIPFIGTSITGQSATISRQRRLNCYIEQRKDQDKSELVLVGTPGLVTTFTIPSSTNSPARGLLGTESSLYAVSANTFFSLGSGGNVLYQSSSLSTFSNLVSMISSGSQTLLVDGFTGYVYDGSVLSAVSPWQAAGAKTCTFVQGFFVAEQPGTQTFWVSNPFDATTWDALALAQAAQFSDNILAVDNTQGMLVCFCQQHMEFFQNVGSSPQPFAGILNSANQWGLAAIFSRVHVSDSILFLGETLQGTRHVCQLSGLTVNKISDNDLDYLLQTFGTYSDAVGMSYTVNGHPMYQLTFPAANRTFLYDTSTGVWAEAQTGISDAPVRHTANLSAYGYGQNYVSDYLTNSIYLFSSGVFTDAGIPIQRELVSRHIYEDYNVFGMDELYVDFVSGKGADSGINPFVMLQVYKDGGHVFGVERWANTGVTGAFSNRLIWRRMGSGRDFVFRLRMTDPSKWVITGVAASMRMRQQ